MNNEYNYATRSSGKVLCSGSSRIAYEHLPSGEVRIRSVVSEAWLTVLGHRFRCSQGSGLGEITRPSRQFLFFSFSAEKREKTTRWS